jgi:hypothetical protein
MPSKAAGSAEISSAAVETRSATGPATLGKGEGTCKAIWAELWVGGLEGAEARI